MFCSDSYFDAARRGQCVNSVPRRMSGAHAPRSAIPHMSRPGCEPARCVHRTASGSRRQGVVGVHYPDADSCPRRMSRTHARTHWRAACKWGGAASSCRSASRFKLAVQSSAFGGGRAVGVCMTVRRPLLPRVIRWGIHREYLTAAKRVLSPFQRMLQMWFVSPNPHPRFRQSHSTVRLPCASSSRSMQPNIARMAVL